MVPQEVTFGTIMKARSKRAAARTKTFGLCAVALSICGYAAYRGLESLAISGLIGALCVAYKNRLASVYSVALDLIKNTQEAKAGSLEIRTKRRLEELVGRLDNPPMWAAVLFGHLSGEEMALLVSVSRHEKFSSSTKINQQLRRLRDLGLVGHNKPALEDSDIVWVTDSGREFAQLLSRPPCR